MFTHIHFSKSFGKKFTKLPKYVQEKFKSRIEIFSNEPLARELRNHKLKPPFMGVRSIDITGDYRALYVESDGIVEFFDIGTHSQLY